MDNAPIETPADIDEERLRILHTIAETLNRMVSLEDAVQETLELVVELLGLDTGWAFLRPEEEGEPFPVAATTGLPPALVENEREPLRCGDCRCQDLFGVGKLSRAINIVYCSRLDSATGDKGGLMYHASVPLRAGERRLGILNVAAQGEELFTEEALELLSAVGLHLGAAITRAEQAQRLAALEERQRLARDLHDSVSQSLFSMRLSLRAVRSRLERAEGDAGDEEAGGIQDAESLIDRLNDQLSETQHQMRSLIFDRREAVEGEDLQRLIEDHYASFLAENRPALHCDITPAAVPASPECRRALAGIAQEALTNVVKHAGAANVWVTLERQGEEAVLQVRDDGCGIDVDEAEGGDTYGLISMRQRAETAGGSFTVEGTADGTELTVHLPL